MAQRENFYLLLDLDLSEKDWAVIETRIQEKRRAWSKDRSQGNPKARRRAERYLALVPQIETVLKDPETRKGEAREAKKRQQELLRERLQGLDEAIALIRSSGGTYDETQLKRLVGRFKDVLSEGEIEKRLRAAGVKPVEAASKRERRVKDRIDKVTASNIRRNLEHLGLANLYDFLGLRPQSSPKALTERAEEILKENHRLGKTDADSSAKNELAGQCKTLFQSAEAKEKYDNSLALEAMEGLKENLELVGSDRIITVAEMKGLLQQAVQRGVPAEDARGYIEDYAAKRKWAVQDAEATEVEALAVCGFCAALAQAGARQCGQCGEALQIDCPRCGTATPTSNAACTACGCRTGDAPLVQSLLREGKRLASEGTFAEALQCFDQALHYWPDWQPAVDGKKRIDDRRREREDELAALEKEVQQRRLATAQIALGRFERRWGGAGLDELKERVREGIAKAEQASQEGERHRESGRIEDALDHYDAAVAACADFEAALRALAASPPPPPSGLEVRTSSSGFRLSWKPPGTRRRVAYRVLRKVGAVPRDARDGTDLGELHGTSLDDPSAPVGEVLFYSVFALRSSVPSEDSAASGPHLRTAEVEDLEALSGNREVTLRWKRPPGCRRVLVWRSSPAVPEGAGKGVELTASGDTLHDIALENGRSYGYRIVAAFPDPDRPGKEVLTPGEKVTAVPVAPPEKVSDLRASRRGATVLLTWTPVPGVAVQLRQSDQPTESVPGQIFSISHLQRFGAPVPSSSPGSAQFFPESQGRTFVVPFSVIADTAVAGDAVEITLLDPVSDLEARRVGSGILLTWTWPSGLKEAQVCHGPDSYPKDPRHHVGPSYRITRREYQRADGWLLRYAERVPHYFSVFAKGGDELYAAPAQILVGMGQTASVIYRVVVKRKLLRRSLEDAWLELSLSEANGNEPALRDLVVVGKFRQVPLSPKDGEVIASVRSVSFEDGVARIPLPRESWAGAPFVKLFFQDASRARQVRLLPAAKERLQVR